MKRISDIPLQDRPREKLQQNGAQSLSDQELLAILLGSGTRGQDVKEVYKRFNGENAVVITLTNHHSQAQKGFDE
ncbi:MAG: UPF0758 domain-containing protein [Deltaproteobacteria bacterium]|nr:UPF0758 domain-containing protein [Deltaproteobacteria bacterium]